MPANTEHYVGGTKHFECRVKGHPRPEIRWFKDSKEITDNRRYNFEVTHDGLISMSIEHITHDDEGVYRCMAENCEGIASTSAYLFVREHKDHPEEAQTSIHAMEIEEAVVFTEKEKMERRLSAAANGSEPHFQTAIHDADEDSKAMKLNEEDEELIKKTFNTLIEESSSTRKITTTIEETTKRTTSVTTSRTEKESSKIEQDQSEKAYHSEGSYEDDDFDSVKLSAISERSETTSSIQDMLVDFDREESKSLLMKQTERILKMEGDEDDIDAELGTTSMKSESVEVKSKSVKVSGKTTTTVTTSKQEISSSSGSSSKQESSEKVEKVEAIEGTAGDKKKTESGVAVKEEVVEAAVESATESETASSVNSVVAADSVKKLTKSEVVEEIELTKKKVGDVESTSKTAAKSIAMEAMKKVSSRGDEEIDVTKQTAEWVDQLDMAAKSEENPDKLVDAEEKPKEDAKKDSKPEFEGTMEDVSIDEGKILKLQIKIKGKPQPEVTWFRDGKAILQSERVSITQEVEVYTLQIKKTTVSDSGSYKLVATNSIGETSLSVTVEITNLSEDGAADKPVDSKLKQEVESTPKFTTDLHDVSVSESETLKLSCSVSGDPTPSVSWEKNSKRLISNQRTRMYQEAGVQYLEITGCEIEDAGDYACVASNNVGNSSLTATVTITVKEKPQASQEAEKETTPMSSIEDTLDDRKTKGGMDISSSANELSTDAEEGRIYKVVMGYDDTETNMALMECDIVEVIDSKYKKGLWKVTIKGSTDKVCSVPPENLSLMTKSEIEDGKADMQDGDKESRKRKLQRLHSSKSNSMDVDMDTSEDETRLQGIFPVYVAIADYTPIEGSTSGLRLSEGQIVEVIDMERADSWLIRTRPTKNSPSRQGWVPSAYLEEKSSSAQVLKRNTKEQFREDVLKVTNKQQEAGLRRRYVMKELEETEREYVKELKHISEGFKMAVVESTEKMPEALVENAETIFSNVDDIYKFHNDKFLPALIECTVDTSAIGSTFLTWKSEFDNYIQYWADRDDTAGLLQSEEIQKFFKTLGEKLHIPGDDMQTRLNKPLDRLKMYQVLLKDILRYSVRAGENCAEIEAAIAMLIAIEKAVNSRKLLPLIEGYEGEITDLGNLMRHDDFLVWEGEVLDSKMKDRHLFLFGDKLILTKKRKPDSGCDEPIFSYKSAIDLTSVRLNGSVPEDDRRFELWFVGDSAVEKITFQARSVYAQQAWVRDLREALIRLGISDPDAMPEKTVEMPEEETAPSSAPGTPTTPAKSGSARAGTQASDEGEATTATEDWESDSTIKADTKDEPDKSETGVNVAVVEDDVKEKEEEKAPAAVAPFLKEELKTVVCTESSCAKLQCVVGGQPTPTVKWSKGSKKILTGSGVDISYEEGVSTVTFTKVKSSQAGTYTVTLTNDAGSVSLDVELVVQLDSEKPAPLETESGKETPFDELDSSSPDRPEPEQILIVDEIIIPEEKPQDKEGAISKAPEKEVPKETQDSQVIEEKVENVENVAPKDETDAKPGIIQEEAKVVEFDAIDKTDSVKAVEEVDKKAEAKAVKQDKVADIVEEKVEPIEAKVEEKKAEPVAEKVVETIQEEKVEAVEEKLEEKKVEPVEEKAAETKVEEKKVEPVEEQKLESVEEKKVEPVEDKKVEPVEDKKAESVEEKKVEPVEKKKVEPVEEKKVEPVEEKKVETVEEKKVEPVKEKPEITEKVEEKKVEPVEEKKVELVEEKKVESVEEKKVEPAEEKPEITEKVEDKKVEPVEEKKVEPVEEKKVELVEEKKVEPVEEKPEITEKVEDKKAEPVEEKKVEPVEEKKVELVEEKKVEPVETKKVEPVEDKKVKAVEQKKVEPVEEKKVEPVEEKKVEPVEKEKVEPVEDKTVKAVEKKKVEPVEEKKVEPVEEKKVEPVEEKKVEPVEEKKVEPVEEKKVEPVEEKVKEKKVESVEEKVEPVQDKKLVEPVEEKVKEPVAESKPIVAPVQEETVAPVEEKEFEVAVEKEVSEEEQKRAEKNKDRKPDAPQIIESMDDVVIELGDLARFDCRVSAYPDPEITWFKDGHKVTATDRHQLLNFHDDIFSLLIKSVERDDSGKYTCLAKNVHGEAKSEAILNVLAMREKIKDAHVAPAFMTKFYDIEAVEGVPVEFVCVVDGNPEPQITWFLNGKEVENSSEILTRRQDDSVMLAFRSVQVEHSGEIVCKIKNDSGESMCKARLQVQEDVTKRGDRPIFLERPLDTEVNEGGEVTFECIISGMPEPDVTWYFNSRELHESRRRVMKRRPGQKYTLTVKEIIPENAGVYTCKAVNRAGDASCAVELSVKELPTDKFLKGRSWEKSEYDIGKYAFPPSFTRRMTDQRVLPGRMARFECMVIGVPEPEVEWQKDGYTLKWGPKYKIGREGHNAILVVENCDTIDEGVYTCTLFNDAGKAFCTSSLRVQAEERSRESLPRFISPALGVDAYNKKSPAPKKQEPKAMAPEDKIPSMPIDKPVLLEVKSNAAKLSWMPAPTAMLPDNAQKISYIVEARERPNKNWVRMDGQIESTTHYVYGLKPDKEYNFRVKAENRYGVSEATLPCSLLPREEPKMPYFSPRDSETPSRPVLPRSRPYVSDIGKETIHLGWKPAEMPYKRSTSMPPVSYRVEAQKLPSEEWVPLASRIRKPSLYLSDLESDRDYNIRIRAQTPYGISQPTEPLWIPRAKGFTGVPVTRPTIVEIDEDTARLAWSRVDIPAFDRTDDPLLYMVEMQEPPSYRWRELARRVPSTYYMVRDLEQGQDYRFRVRAETKEGLLSEPSPATSIFRTLAMTHTPVDKVEIEEYDADLEALRLKWSKVDVPPFSNKESPLLYMIEYQSPEVEGWKKLVSGVPTTSYRVPDISPSKDYRFRVRGLTPYGASPPSYPIGLHRNMSPMRPLAQDLRISDMKPDSLSLSWRSASLPPAKATSEPPSYQIEAMEYPRREWRPLASNVRDTNYRLTGLKASSDYSFRVRAQTPSGLLAPTAPVTLTSLPVKPRLSSREPVLSELGSDSIRIQWQPAELPYYSRHTTPISYTVEYQEIPSRDWVVAKRGIPDTSYTLSGLRADRDYRFRVCPETQEGPGDYSIPVNIHRKPAPILPSKEPALSNITPSSATISWQPAKMPSGSLSRNIFYRVEVREPPRSSWSELAGRLSSTSYDAQFLHPDQDYMFRVIADHEGIESDPTMSVYLPRRSGPPKMPRDAPYASNVQPDSLILSWRSVELPSRITDYSPVSYRVEVQEHNRSSWRPLERQLNQTHYHVTKLRPDLDYSFRIRAENEFGISDPTEALVVRKRAVAPSISQHEPLISDVRSDSLRLSWQPADLPLYLADSVPVNYNVLMQEAGDSQWQTIARKVAGTNYYVTGLAPDKDYSFRVQATNDFGTSIPTMPARFTRQFQGPIYIPEIEDPEPASFRLSWKRPSVSKTTTYSIETLEPSTWKWRPLVSRLPHPSYKVSNLSASRDYAFRVRAEIDSVVSEPSLPISFSSRRGNFVDMDSTETQQALPSLPVERPTLSEVFDDSVRVSWHPVLYRGATLRSAPEGYRLEVRELPDSYWKTLIPNTNQWSYEVTDLKPGQDYAFRVRTVSKSGMSEPSPAAYLYRQTVTPRVPLPSPEVSDVGDDYINLRWKTIDVPAFDHDEKPLSFIIEAQRLPEYEWKPVASGITGASHKVTGLEPKQDYKFRIRGETPIGLTQPTHPVPVYRRPLGSGIPITNLSIDSDSNQPYSARLKWNPVYTRPYTATKDTTYTIEVQEPPRRDWYSLAKDVSTTSYTVPDLSPRKNYLFRIKARAGTGDYSIPTLPIPYYREPSSSWDSLPARPLPVEDYTPLNRPYIEGLVLKVPPRMSIEKPELFVVTPDVVRLSWKSARVPSATAHLSPTTYRVEVRHEDSFEWVEKVTGVTSLGTDIRGLNPHIDYAFRVRAVNEFGWSECTLPVFLHRPQDVKDVAAEKEFEEFEVTGSLLGDTSAPKMPIDTPRMGIVENGCMKLSWTPARIPAYARKTRIFYLVEKKEATDTEWITVARDIHECYYVIDNIRPNTDYLFRVKAQNEYGTSEGTLPAALNQTRGSSVSRRSTMSRERDTESSTSSRRSSYSYIDSIAEGVPPRVPHGRPTITDVTETTLVLSWKNARMPSYITGKVNIKYMVEAREPPNHLWRKLATDVSGTSFQVIALRADQDYMFRVRAFNDAGMSEPTLPVTFTHERVVEVEPRTLRRRSSVERFSSVERRLSRERSMSMERGASLPRAPSMTRDAPRKDVGDEDEFTTPETAPAAPSFVEAESPSVQYGIDARPVKITLQLRGLPLPNVDWFYNGKKILYGDRHEGYVTPTGLVVLEFGPMKWSDVGEYKCVAENELGETSLTVKLDIADPPVFLQPLEELNLQTQVNGKFVCRVEGLPYPSVKFMKDWRPITESSRLKVSQVGDQWTLDVEQPLPTDSGCYICMAENVAGSVFCTARLNVDDDEPVTTIFYKKNNIEDDYYILEELGRGRFSIVRRVIEKSTGKEFAAKFTQVREENDKDFFRLELDALVRQTGNGVQKLHDAYETQRQLILVVDLVKNGTLLEKVVTDDKWTEAKAAQVIRTLLHSLVTIHKTFVVHLDIKPSNLRLASSSYDSLHLIDFGFARKLPLSRDLILNHGTPEFSSPEAVKGEALTTASDLWAVGILTHILLTGVSPFYGEKVQGTLTHIQTCNWQINDQLFTNLSAAAKDFILKLIVMEPDTRLTVEACLAHDWLKMADKTDCPSIDILPIKAFHQRHTAEQQESSVRGVACLRSLQRLLEGTAVRQGLQPETDPETGKTILPDTDEYGQYLDEESWYEWQSRHQQGPDSELFPLKDASYAARVRGYKRAAGSVDDQASIVIDSDDELDSTDKDRMRTMKERKLMSEIDKEEIPPSLEKELEWMEETKKRRKSRDPDEFSLSSKRSSITSINTEGMPGPSFKEKLHDMAFGVGDTVILRCVVAVPPTPTVVWYKNEELLSDGHRLKMNLEEDGEATLTIRNAKPYDAGVYKCVGRSKFGRVSNRMRLRLGDVPGRPGRPVANQISSTEAVIIWEAPKFDGNSDILFYKLDYKTTANPQWQTAAYTPEEAAFITGLTPETSYIFRVSATNRIGTGHYSWASVDTCTRKEGYSPITTDEYLDLNLLQEQQHLEQPGLPTEFDDIITEEELKAAQSEIAVQKCQPDSVFNIGSTLYKGKFYEDKAVTLPSQNDKPFVLRTIHTSRDVALKEFELLKSLCHERVWRISHCFEVEERLHFVLDHIEADHVARHLSHRRKYTENTVAVIIRQVLFGLEYLHRQEIAHLNLQPASVLIYKREGPEIKLADFSCTRKISSQDGEMVPRIGHAQFIAPEVVVQDLVDFAADVWGVGVLMFVLLSGLSPFKGENDTSTLVNVAFNRYDAADLYENITTDALKFLYKVMKRIPRNRLTVQECLEHKWLQMTDKLTKDKDSTVFLSNTLATFVQEYDTSRQRDDFSQDFRTLDLPVKMATISPPEERARLREEANKRLAARSTRSTTPLKKQSLTLVERLQIKADMIAAAEKRRTDDVRVVRKGEQGARIERMKSQVTSVEESSVSEGVKTVKTVVTTTTTSSEVVGEPSSVTKCIKEEKETKEFKDLPRPEAEKVEKMAQEVVEGAMVQALKTRDVAVDEKEETPTVKDSKET